MQQDIHACENICNDRSYQRLKSNNYSVVGLFHMWEFQRGYGTGLLSHQHVCVNTIPVFLVFVTSLQSEYLTMSPGVQSSCHLARLKAKLLS